MYVLIYSAVILIATFCGAFVGLGGGVIIKPALDAINIDTIDTVNFISCCAVFAMSISSSLKQLTAKTKYDLKYLLLVSCGSLIGGVPGSHAFNTLLEKFGNNSMKSIQGIILGTVLVLAVIYINLKNPPSLNTKNPVCLFLSGLFLGALASFLGVGGGPINVAFLMFLSGLDIKSSTVYSIGIVFFSQLSKLITLFVTSSIPAVKTSVIAVAVISAVSGGIIGATLNKKCSNKPIKTVFTVVVIAVALLNFYNAFIFLK